MDDSERCVNTFLIGLGLGTVIYEPDGKVPPDFLVDGRIAVEVRRLNHNELTAEGYCGLEDTAKPLKSLVRHALADIGPPVHGTSWFVSCSFSRPRPPRRELDAELRKALHEVADLPTLEKQCLRVGGALRLEFFRASKAHSQLFVLDGFWDYNAGGFELAQMAANLPLCIAEKTAKIADVRHRYNVWWLALVDRIADACLSEDDQEQLRELVPRDDNWHKILLVGRQNPAVWFEL